ncbi:MAG: glycosyltransferase [Nocardiaceae bacterium]|nr:glycosyltransferase [Nocardiaceae bacterium]
MLTTTKVAIAHDYLTQRGGAERVVLAMASAFPGAEIHTTLYSPETTFEEFRDLNVKVSPLNRVRAFREDHRRALPVLPVAARRLRIDADVVISSSSGWAHGITTHGRKLVYCHTPARWLYESEESLGAGAGLAKRAALRLLTPALLRWDRKSAASADRYLAVSEFIQDRLNGVYGFEANILYPPYADGRDTAREPVPGLDKWLAGSDYYLCVSRLMPYKHVDTVVRAFADGSRKLVLVGTGPDEQYLRSIASNNVLMLRDIPDSQLHTLYGGCRGLVAASHEDFGLTPLEAASHGKASVLLRRGGYLESMVESVTCEFFDRVDPSDIVLALDRFESAHWDANKISAHAETFGFERFAVELRAAVKELLT